MLPLRLSFLLVVSLFAGSVEGLGAQDLRGKARSDDSKLVLLVGAQSHAFRRARREGGSSRGLDREIGLRLGLHWELPVRYNQHMILGLDFIQERGTVLNYTDPDRTGFNTLGVTGSLSTISEGRLRFREEWLRQSVLYRYSTLRFAVEGGLALNIIGNANEPFRYDYVRAVTAFFDEETFSFVPIDEPVAFAESNTRDNADVFLGVVVGVSFVPVHRLRVRLEYERSVHFSDRFVGNLTKRGRLGLTLGYRLFPLR